MSGRDGWTESFYSSLLDLMDFAYGAPLDVGLDNRRGVSSWTRSAYGGVVRRMVLCAEDYYMLAVSLLTLCEST